jgi:LPS export ABC transporter protein LptC
MNGMNSIANLFRPARIIFLPLALLCIGCGQSDETSPQTVGVIPNDAPNEESWNATLLFTDSNWTKARLQVGHARKYAARMQTLLDSGVYVEFYDRDGSLNVTLLADSAHIDDRTGDMTAYGSVHVDSDKNRTIVDTDRLHYESKSRRLTSDAFVKIVDSTRGRTLQGKGFESDEGLQNYKIYNVSGKMMGGG